MQRSLIHATSIYLVLLCSTLVAVSGDVTSESNAQCGVWSEGADFYGYDITSADAANPSLCQQRCSLEPGCNAVTYVASDSKCYLKQVPASLVAVEHEACTSLRLCANQTLPGPDIRPSINAPAPGFQPEPGFCGEWMLDHSIKGVEVVSTESSPPVNEHDCLNRCAESRPCNVAQYDYRQKLCTLLEASPDAVPVTEADFKVMRLCDRADELECGRWYTDEDISGFDIKGIDNSLQVNGDRCMARCQRQAGCNAVVFKKHNKECWLKGLPPEGLRAELVGNVESDTFMLCPSQTLEGPTSEPSETLNTGAVAGVVVAAVLAVCLVGALVWMLVVRAKTKRRLREASVKLGSRTITSGMLGSGTLSGVPNISNSGQISRGSGWRQQAVSATNTNTASDTVNVLKMRTTEGTLPELSTSAELVAASPCWFTSLSQTEQLEMAASPSPHLVPGGGADSSAYQRFSPAGAADSSAPQQFVAAGGADSSGQQNFVPADGVDSSAHRRFVPISQVPTTTWEMSVLPAPAPGATKSQLMAFLHNQLDHVEAAEQQRNSPPLIQGIRFCCGPYERLEGGQAIVQMAQSSTNRMEYAVKFFMARSAFEQERRMYCGDSPLGQFLPQVRAIIDNDNRQLLDPGGHPLPPCIVMERGEALDVWSARNAADRAQAFTVVYHIAQRMMEFHVAGYVHRDLKPGNVMWLPRANRWTVIDFGCAARHQEVGNISYTLRYAAPEVIKAKRSGKTEMVLEESLDAWSLGVMAFELCTGAPPFPRGTSPEKIMDQIEGVNGEMLPWEGHNLTAKVRSKLMLFQDALLQLLQRDPLLRPSMRHFCRTCASILGDHSAQDGDD